MASPYFTPIRVRPINTAGMAEAGRAIGQSYAQMGSVIGKAIGTMGNAYFEDKKLERTMMAYLRSEEGQRFLMDKGYAPTEIQDMVNGVKPLRAEVKKIFKDMGGVEKVRGQIRNDMEFQQRVAINESKLQESQQMVKGLQTQNQEQQKLIDNNDRKKQLLGHLFSNNFELQGYEHIERDGDIIMEVAKDYPQLGLQKPSFPNYLSSIDPKVSPEEAVKRYSELYNVGTEEAEKNLDYAKSQQVKPKSGAYEVATLDAIDKALALVDPESAKYNPRSAGTTGRLTRASGYSSSDAYALGQYVKTIKAQTAFGRLTAMREESKTGGALGAIAVAELELLESSLGALDPNMEDHLVHEQLLTIRKHYQRVLDVINAEKIAFQQGLDPFRTEEDALAFIAEHKKQKMDFQQGSEKEAIQSIVMRIRNGESAEQIRDSFLAGGTTEEEFNELIRKAQAQR